jgi:hypothetical protein
LVAHKSVYIIFASLIQDVDLEATDAGRVLNINVTFKFFIENEYRQHVFDYITLWLHKEIFIQIDAFSHFKLLGKVVVKVGGLCGAYLLVNFVDELHEMISYNCIDIVELLDEL